MPEHLVVIGGSYAGLGFAQMFRRFGSAMTVIEAAPRLVGREDPDISDAVRHILEAVGIPIRLDTRTRQVGPGVRAGVEDTAGLSTIEGPHLLLAVGRHPNTKDLELDKAGIALDSRGYIQVDDIVRTNVPHIWALGECKGMMPSPTPPIMTSKSSPVTGCTIAIVA